MDSNTGLHKGPTCQLSDLPGLAEPMGTWEKIWQKRFRGKRLLLHGLRYFGRGTAELAGMRNSVTAKTAGVGMTELKPGDLVRVRSREEIELTLDRRGKLAHCGFMDEMWPYCGTTHRVLKRVEQFLDERDYRVHKARHIVLLDGIVCQGTRDYGRCDRACFFFWREEWLEKIEPS